MTVWSLIIILLADYNLAVLPPYRTYNMHARVNKINLTDLMLTVGSPTAKLN